MAQETVNAKWVGPFEAIKPGIPEPLVPGETVVEMPKAEAQESDYWEPVGGKPASERKSDS